MNYQCPLSGTVPLIMTALILNERNEHLYLGPCNAATALRSPCCWQVGALQENTLQKLEVWSGAFGLAEKEWNVQYDEGSGFLLLLHLLIFVSCLLKP